MSTRLRALILFLSNDLGFSALLVWVYITCLNLQSSDALQPIVMLFLVLVALKVALAVSFLIRATAPIQDWESAVKEGQSGDQISDELIREAFKATHVFPRTHIFIVSMAFPLIFILVSLAVVILFSDSIDVGQNIWVVTALMSISTCVGSFGVTQDMKWVASQASRGLMKEAQGRSLDLDLPEETLLQKTVLHNVSLCVLATLWVSLLFFKYLDHQSLERTKDHAALATQRFRFEATQKYPGPVKHALIEAIKAHNEATRTDKALFFLIESQIEDPTAGAPKPSLAGGSAIAWLKAQDLKLRFDAVHKQALNPKADAPQASRAFVSRQKNCTVSCLALASGLTLGVIQPNPSLPWPAFWLTASLFFLTIAVVTILNNYYYHVSIVQPLRSIGQLFSDLNETGKIEQAEYIPVIARDEVGQISVTFNELLAQLKALVAQSQKVAAGHLNVPISGQGDLQEAFRQMILRVKGTVEEITQQSVSLSQLGSDLFGASQAQEGASQEQSSYIDEVACNLEELNHGIGQVSESMQQILKSADQSLSSAEQSVSKVGELSQKAKNVQALLESIRRISKKSRMLSINAGIESARAGQAGRSFSVIAQEARRLSEQIEDTVTKVQTIVEEIDQAGDVSMSTAQDNREFAVTTARLAQEISAIALEQQSSTELITHNLRDVSAAVAETAAMSGEIRSCAESLYGRAHRLTSAVGQFSLSQRSSAHLPSIGPGA